jgi:hypothetical protein
MVSLKISFKHKKHPSTASCGSVVGKILDFKRLLSPKKFLKFIWQRKPRFLPHAEKNLFTVVIANVSNKQECFSGRP